ncbi:MAG: shikimate dehydrogenase [Acidimicrobiales bacterium]
MPGGGPGVLSAATRVAGVIGDPVHHSLSPAMHNAAYAALDLDWVYVAFPVPSGRGEEAVGVVRSLGLAGLSVTMPHKAAAAQAVDRLSPTAARLGVVNTVFLEDGELVGDSTDGAGFVDSLRAEGWDPRGRKVLLLGTGGAARAVCLALAQAGVGEVAVAGRRPEAVEECAALAGGSGRSGSVEQADAADLVVNATPAGMLPGSSAPRRYAVIEEGLPLGLDAARLGPGQLVVDLVYAPPVTPLLAAAAGRGATTANGLGTLLHQAGRQLSMWTGLAAPLEVMAAAARQAMAAAAERPAET